jgi:hypothetical protein
MIEIIAFRPGYEREPDQVMSENRLQVVESSLRQDQVMLEPTSLAMPIGNLDSCIREIKM